MGVPDLGGAFVFDSARRLALDVNSRCISTKFIQHRNIIGNTPQSQFPMSGLTIRECSVLVPPPVAPPHHNLLD
jgi:hypothetical protein